MTRNPRWPAFLSSPDPDGLNAIERAALKPLRERFAVGSQTDQWHAGLRYGGHVLRLTLDTLDQFACDYERWCWSETLILAPPGWDS